MPEIELRLAGLSAGYGNITVLRDVDLSVERGQILGVFGANGAGKTTLLRTVSRLTNIFAGAIEVSGVDATRLGCVEVSRMGVAHVPEGRRVLKGMSVEENLLVGARMGRRSASSRLSEVYELFPRLDERSGQKAESLSGGEQQMLAIGRALMMKPRLIMMDEPSQGLSPALVQTVLESITRIAATGVTVLVVEQNFHVMLPVVTSAAVVSHGCVRAVSDMAQLASGEGLLELLRGVL